VIWQRPAEKENPNDIAMNKKEGRACDGGGKLVGMRFSAFNLASPTCRDPVRGRRDPDYSLRQGDGAHAGLCTLGVARKWNLTRPPMSLPGMRHTASAAWKKQFDKESGGRAGASRVRSRLWPHHPEAGQGCGRTGEDVYLPLDAGAVVGDQKVEGQAGPGGDGLKTKHGV